jgi:hypothetical protein
MRGVVPLLVLLLHACLPAPGPGADEAPELATPQAPAALAAPAVAPDEAAAAEDGLLAVPLDSVPAGEILGRVIVSPGNAAEPGLWLRTSRTARTAQGTVVANDGASVDVVLIPADGVSQLSAEGYAALGLAPGSFVEVTIYLR